VTEVAVPQPAVPAWWSPACRGDRRVVIGAASRANSSSSTARSAELRSFRHHAALRSTSGIDPSSGTNTTCGPTAFSATRGQGRVTAHLGADQRQCRLGVRSHLDDVGDEAVLLRQPPQAVGEDGSFVWRE
jgi:hypothetical protein